MAHRHAFNWKVLFTCFFRTYFVGAAFNTRGMQNVGLVFVLEPGLKAIYKDPEARREARNRYLRHYNTHPFWTPLLAGMFLSLEDKISRGGFPPSVLESMKNTTIYTLSAIGDSVFAGSLLVFWSLSTVIFLVSGQILSAVLWGVLWLSLLQLFKLYTFILGYREGLKFLVRLKRWDLINWGQRLKMFNALLVALLLFQIWPEAEFGPYWIAAVAALLVSAWLVFRSYVGREMLALLLLLGYVLYPHVEEYVRSFLSGIF